MAHEHVTNLIRCHDGRSGQLSVKSPPCVRSPGVSIRQTLKASLACDKVLATDTLEVGRIEGK
jgi:hypothetical protein